MIVPPALDSLAPLTSQRVRLPKHGKYNIKNEGVFTVVSRTAPLPLNNAIYALCYRWARAHTRWIPLLLRFIRMAASLNPGRFAIYFLGRVLSSLMDTASLWSDTRFEALVEQAVGQRVVRQTSLLGYAIANIFSTGLRTKIEGLFTHNEGVLSSTFDVAVRKQLIAARGRLDITTLADPIVSSAFRQASALQAVDVASHVVNLFTGAFSVWSQLSLYRMLSSHRRTISYKPVLVFAFAGSLIQYFRWFFMPQSAERTRSTHYAFQRLNELWAVSCQAEDATKSADNKLLGLEEYLTRQFDLASDKLGELAFIRNKTKSLLQFSFELSSHAWPVLLRAFFAIRALRSPKSVETLSQLSITMLCTRKIAHSVSSLVSTVDDLRLDCTKLKAFYQVLEVESLIKEPLVPLEYKAHTGILGSGMKIEFKDVSFGYRGPDGPMALKNLNFTLLPGALVCVVGGNGAGKSTLIKLLTRLYEPTTGEILLNDQPIAAYSHSELLKYMTVQLQNVPVTDVTIAEFVALGAASQRADKPIDVRAVKDALAKAEATAFVERLDKGIWARLGPFPPRPTAQRTLNDAIYEDEQAEDEWKSEEKLATVATAPDKKSSTRSQTVTKRDTTWSLNLSGGEWAKICFARSLMKKADLRIFDEPAAALDALAQKAIFQNIEELRGKQTIVHITHHLRSSISADLVLCLKDGELVEQGTHYDLILRPNGFYRSLAEVQMPEALIASTTPPSTPSLSGDCTPSESDSEFSSDSGFFGASK